MIFKIAKFLSDDLMVAGWRLWSGSKARGRTKRCRFCQCSIVSGDRSWRPLAEGGPCRIVLDWRICGNCADVADAELNP